jgi:hemerythrin-like domain-containing protein
MPLAEIEQLSIEHAEIDAIAAELIAVVTRYKAPVDGMAAQRWRLNHLLSVHLAKEDKHLYPMLKRAADREIAALATEMEAEMGNLAAQFLAYSRRWDAKAMTEDWSGFCTDTLRVMQALRQRIRREERDLYPRVVRARRTPNAA